MLKSMILASLLFVLASAPARAVFLSIDPPSQAVSAGSAFDIAVTVSGLGGFVPPTVSVFDLDIDFDPLVTGFQSVEFGQHLGDINAFEASILFDTLRDADTVHVGESSFLEESSTSCIVCLPPYLEDLQPDTFVLATLHFNALLPGVADFRVSVNSFGDGFGNPLAVDQIDNGSVSVTTVPEPPVLLLFAFVGLAMMVRWYLTRGVAA